jgi:predicted transcriptional regulator
VQDEEDEEDERVRSHSTRAALLALLAEGERKLSTVEIRAELPCEADLRSVYYHLRVLEAGEMIAREGNRYKLC